MNPHLTNTGTITNIEITTLPSEIETFPLIIDHVVYSVRGAYHEQLIKSLYKWYDSQMVGCYTDIQVLSQDETDHRVKLSFSDAGMDFHKVLNLVQSQPQGVDLDIIDVTQDMTGYDEKTGNKPEIIRKDGVRFCIENKFHQMVIFGAVRENLSTLMDSWVNTHNHTLSDRISQSLKHGYTRVEMRVMVTATMSADWYVQRINEMSEIVKERLRSRSISKQWQDLMKPVSDAGKTCTYLDLDGDTVYHGVAKHDEGIVGVKSHTSDLRRNAWKIMEWISRKLSWPGGGCVFIIRDGANERTCVWESCCEMMSIFGGRRKTLFYERHGRKLVHQRFNRPEDMGLVNPALGFVDDDGDRCDHSVEKAPSLDREMVDALEGSRKTWCLTTMRIGDNTVRGIDFPDEFEVRAANEFGDNVSAQKMDVL